MTDCTGLVTPAKPHPRKNRKDIFYFYKNIKSLSSEQLPKGAFSPQSVLTNPLKWEEVNEKTFHSPLPEHSSKNRAFQQYPD